MSKLILTSLLCLLPAGALAGGEEPCPGDCDGNGTVSVNELILGVNILLGRADAAQCPAVDVDGNGTVAVNELITAVNSALDGCGGGAATFAEVQAIFNAQCAVPQCHVPPFPAGLMDLSEGAAFDEIVGVAPANAAAEADGLLRIDPGNPMNSFILIKVSGMPPFEYGSRMPLLRDPLGEDDVRTIREWVAAGANP